MESPGATQSANYDIQNLKSGIHDSVVFSNYKNFTVEILIT